MRLKSKDETRTGPFPVRKQGQEEKKFPPGGRGGEERERERIKVGKGQTPN
jgi:hypothetical protein